MADAREEKVWTVHSEEHKSHDLHKVTEDIWLRKQLVANVPKGTLVVDFGCGSGLWRNLFEGYKYMGLDQNPGMIAVAQSRKLQDASFQITEWNKLSLADNTLDLIFTSAVIQHNKHDQKRQVLSEFLRVLKPGGFFLCTENTFRPDNYSTTFRNKPFREDLDDGYSFTKSGWEKFMKDSGFELVAYSHPSEYLYRKPLRNGLVQL
jgi:ubiquinone/menaquinone biosynthesis C-methylase UbiE